jgi:cell wall-associated NlpC family hydrolase
MPVPFWAGHYIGLPFAEHGRCRSGLDCWGLVRLVLAEQFGIALPSFMHEYRSARDAQAIGALVEREIPAWQNIAPGAEMLGDVVVLRLCGQPMHVGLVLGDRRMLHIEEGVDSAIENYAGPRWSERVLGFHRYRKAVP